MFTLSEALRHSLEDQHQLGQLTPQGLVTYQSRNAESTLDLTFATLSRCPVRRAIGGASRLRTSIYLHHPQP